MNENVDTQIYCFYWVKIKWKIQEYALFRQEIGHVIRWMTWCRTSPPFLEGSGVGGEKFGSDH
jgi:hypothetical protein